MENEHMENKRADMKAVIQSYENYAEDLRLTADNVRQLEFITGRIYMDKFFKPGDKILDVAAGTGAYALYYAARGYEVTALDITPGYIDILNKKAGKEGVRITSFVNDARDLTVFPDNSFDVVLCMGPIYHLIEEEDRKKVMDECKRVLKPGGFMYLAYINKFFVFFHLALGSKQYLQEKWFQKIVCDSEMSSADEDCFWTDTWFTTPEDIEALAESYGFEKVKHVAQDGIGRMQADEVNSMRPAYFEKWTDYHLRTCEEPSILGISNHGLYIGRKAG